MASRPLAFNKLNLSDPTEVAIYYQTHPIPRTHNAAVVVASIVASVLGAQTTLLLLSRRTATAGIRNWILLLAAASTMGSVGIWGMHFIGMNMALRPTPDITWHIEYDPGFTVLSLFVPMFSLVFAFVFVGTSPASPPADENEESPNCLREGKYECGSKSMEAGFKGVLYSLWRGNPVRSVNLRIVICGIMVGGTVALMHYAAGFNSSFSRHYEHVHIFFSTALACFASTVSLLVFFRFQAQWQDNWWKKLICAVGLATGVCGMHYLGLSGTEWFVPKQKVTDFSTSSRNSTVLTIAIAVMCFAVCVIAFIVALSDFLVTRESRRKARKVVIVSATFDKAGRILVNLDGMLPMCEVETDFNPKFIMEELNYRQPTFQWLYTLSWNWSILDPFLPRIIARSFGLSTPFKDSLNLTSAKRFKGSKEPGSSYVSFKTALQLSIFKDRCIEATQTLASQIGLPIKEIGVFFDNVLLTGTRASPTPVHEKNTAHIIADEESSMFSVSFQQPRQQGVMMFLVRELTGQQQDTVDNYVKRGYRFAETRWFAPVFADRAAVEKAEIDGLLDQLKLYAKRGTKPCVRSGGIYVGFFAVRPSISRQGGIDTLVYQFARHQIPAYRLPDVGRITDDMRTWVSTMAGRNMKDLGDLCLKQVDSSLPPPSGKVAEDMWIFKSSLVLAMDAMSANLKMFTRLAERSVLSAEIVDVPSSGYDLTEPASMIVFQATFPAPSRHGEELPGLSISHEPYGSFKKQEPVPTFVFVPYTLFSKSQMMMSRGSGAKKFSRQARAELETRYPATRETLPNDSTTSAGGNPPTGYEIHHSNHNENFSLPQSPSDVEDVHSDLIERYGNFGEIPTQVHAELAKSRLSGLSIITRSSLKSILHGLIPIPTSSPMDEFLPTSQSNRKQYPNFGSQADGFEARPLSSPPLALISNPEHSPTETWRNPHGNAPPYSAGCHTVFRTIKRNLSTGRGIPSTQNSQSHFSPQNTTSEARSHSNTCDALGAEQMSHSQGEDSLNHDKLRAQALAVSARLRSDDWHLRCLDSLEQSEAGEELLGVQW